MIGQTHVIALAATIVKIAGLLVVSLGAAGTASDRCFLHYLLLSGPLQRFGPSFLRLEVKTDEALA